jgi:hypothetical protein
VGFRATVSELGRCQLAKSRAAFLFRPGFQNRKQRPIWKIPGFRRHRNRPIATFAERKPRVHAISGFGNGKVGNLTGPNLQGAGYPTTTGSGGILTMWRVSTIEPSGFHHIPG